jgi:Polyphosphate kinase 2 (PPK2)
MKSVTISDVLRLAPGPVDLASMDTRGAPGAPGGKATTLREFHSLASGMSDLQERLYAEGRVGERRSILVVLQGVDTSGEGGTVRQVLGRVDHQGVSIRRLVRLPGMSLPMISAGGFGPPCHVPASSAS